jgi:hypothetical protein
MRLAQIALPNGETLTVPVPVGKDGKWLEFLQKLAEIAAQILPVILPLFLDENKKPDVPDAI